jgi:hypothetical protein
VDVSFTPAARIQFLAALQAIRQNNGEKVRVVAIWHAAQIPAEPEGT